MQQVTQEGKLAIAVYFYKESQARFKGTAGGQASYL